jgi:cytochrome c2
VEELQMVRGYSYIATAGVLLALAAPAIALEGNVDAGKKVFAKCAVCHGIGETTKPIGPNLNNVIAEYITDPKKKIPGNKMAFTGLKKEQEIADVIAYVSTFSKP